MTTPETTETLKSIGQLRDSFPQGSEEWLEMCEWYQRCIDLERDERQKETVNATLDAR